MTSSTIFLVDDSRRVLDSTAALLESYGFRVEKYQDPLSFLRQYDPDRPGVLLLDLRMPQIAGIEVLDRLRSMESRLPVLFFTAHAEIDQVVQAMKGGARDFLRKPMCDEELVSRLQDAAIEDLRQRERRRADEEVLRTVRSLTRRERQVLDFAMQGHTSRDIGGFLGITEKTVESHRCHVIQKLEVRNCVELTSKVLLAGYRPSGDGSRPKGR